MPQNPRRENPVRLVYAFLAASGLVLIALLSIPVLDGPHSRQYANEAAALSTLRALTMLERKYAAAHVNKGFACDLPQLRPPESGRNHGDYDSLGFLATGASVGYNLVLANCRTDVKGAVVHYEAAAKPFERGRTGVRAFCTDDSGSLWYDAEGSAKNCLVSRRAIRE